MQKQATCLIRYQKVRPPHLVNQKDTAILILDRRETDLDRNGRPIRPAGAELHRHLTRYNIDISTGIELEFGDAMFAGNGERGECTVAIEHKRLSDLINSMKDRRLSGHQLQGLWRSYDYVFLFAEGVWRPGPGGEIEQLEGKEWKAVVSRKDKYAVNYRQLSAFLHSLSLRSRSPLTGEPLRVVRTQNPKHTAAEYAALYFGFTEKTWDQHHAHDQIYTEITLPPQRAGLTQSAKVTTLWRMLAQIPGVDRKAQQVAEYFGTMRGAALAGLSDRLRGQVEEYFAANPRAAAKEWAKVAGIGKVTAEEAVKVMEEEGA